MRRASLHIGEELISENLRIVPIAAVKCVQCSASADPALLQNKAKARSRLGRCVHHNR